MDYIFGGKTPVLSAFVDRSRVTLSNDSLFNSVLRPHFLTLVEQYLKDLVLQRKLSANFFSSGETRLNLTITNIAYDRKSVFRYDVDSKLLLN